MNTKKTIKIIFITTLTLIFLSLSIITLSKGNLATSINDVLNNNLDYKIIYESDTCTTKETLIYEDNEKKYYVECYALYDIYINWSNGEIVNLQQTIKENRVDMESLKNHGLNIKVVEKYGY